MKEIVASVITIGDELLIGQTIDTNSAYIGQELNKTGIWLKRRIAVGDVYEEIVNTIDTQSKDNDIIIITGGLGPTADDITKPALCSYFNAKMIVHQPTLEHVKNIFAKLNKDIIERNLKQAEVPDNCTVLANSRGTAPGMWFEKNGVVIISLPGVPHEMKGLMEEQVIPKLKSSFSLPHILHKTMLVAGKGESEISEMIEDIETSLPSFIKLAYLPAYGMVRLRLTAKGEQKEIEDRCENYFRQLQVRLKNWVVATEDISLAKALTDVLRAARKTMSTAESCTGGHIAHLITAIAGSSEVYKGSVVAYANQVKQDILDVQNQTLIENGAVSEETVKEMLAGAIRTMKTDYALATSGIMGPGGGTDEKPVGTVWVAVGNACRCHTARLKFRFDRSRNIELTAHGAINMLRKFIIENEANNH